MIVLRPQAKIGYKNVIWTSVSKIALSNIKCSLIWKKKYEVLSNQKQSFSPDSFKRVLRLPCPFMLWIAPLLCFIQKMVPFLPFSEKREKGCLFTIFVYTLNKSYTFKFISDFGNQKCALKNIKSALSLFSSPCLFLSPRETLQKYTQMSKLCQTFPFQ